MKLKHLAFVLYLFYINFTYIYGKVQTVSDDELIEHIRNSERVVVLYVKKDCDECDKYESVVNNLYKDFKEHLNADVYKAVNSPMAALFSPTKEPAIVYFRRGLPLLYHGPLAEEAIVNNFYENPEPIVRELSDENFEHLTQAATGATTGDWFIFFYTTDCSLCQRIHATWEAVGAALKQTVNVARINIQQKGKLTGLRFNSIDSIPEFIFFRLGKLYKLKTKDYTPTTFISFAQGDYKNVKSEDVPPEYTEPIYTKVLEIINEKLENPYALLIIGGVVAVILFLFTKHRLNKMQNQSKEKSKKKK